MSDENETGSAGAELLFGNARQGTRTVRLSQEERADKAILDSICAHRDAEIKKEFDTYGAAFLDDPSFWARAQSATCRELFGTDHGKERQRVKEVFERAQADGKLWTKLKFG